MLRGDYNDNQFIITHSLFNEHCSCMRKMWTDVILCVNFFDFLWSSLVSRIQSFGARKFVSRARTLTDCLHLSLSLSLMPMPPKCNTIIRSANRNRLNYLYSKWTNKLINCPKNFPVFVFVFVAIINARTPHQKGIARTTLPHISTSNFTSGCVPLLLHIIHTKRMSIIITLSGEHVRFVMCELFALFFDLMKVFVK